MNKPSNLSAHSEYLNTHTTKKRQKLEIENPTFVTNEKSDGINEQGFGFGEKNTGIIGQDLSPQVEMDTNSAGLEQLQVKAKLPHRWNSQWCKIKRRLLQISNRELNSVSEFVGHMRLIFSEAVEDDLAALNFVLNEQAKDQTQIYLLKVFPFMALLATQVEEIFEDEVPLLVQSLPRKLDFSKKQCCCLLSLAFFDALPCNGTHRKTKDTTEPDMPSNLSLRFWAAHQPEKLKCILQYFRIMQTRAEQNPQNWGSETVSFVRKVQSLSNLSQKSPKDFLCECQKQLTALTIDRDDVIENAKGMLQADFANQFIGGGVLRRSCVQEEIRFMICPECLCSIWLCERMDQNEAIVIIGAERFCCYSGYGRNTFKFAGGYYAEQDNFLESGALDIHLVAFDARPVPFATQHAQYQEDWILRDLEKVYAALCYDPAVDKHKDELKCFASGNWGCGAFNGDPQLKSLLQWIICTATDRSLLYFVHGDERMSDFQTLANCLRKNQVTLGQLSSLIFQFASSLDPPMCGKQENNEVKSSLFDFLLASFVECTHQESGMANYR